MPVAVAPSFPIILEWDISLKSIDVTESRCFHTQNPYQAIVLYGPHRSNEFQWCLAQSKENLKKIDKFKVKFLYFTDYHSHDHL